MTGAVLLCAGVALVLLPLVLGRWSANKYIVISGLLIAVAGAGMLVNGGVDAIRGRRP